MPTLNHFIEERRKARIRAYVEMPADIKEHHGIEDTVLAGGYAYRQLLELVQNGADAISDGIETGRVPLAESGRIEVLLADRRLYVANTGAALTKDGIEALLQSHSSPKRGNQIGRFGLGFKSLLKLGGKIDMLSTSASLRFDPDRCRRELAEQFHRDEVPGLRLAWSLDRAEESKVDAILSRFEWATTVVRADVANDDLMEHLREEIRVFPIEFLLFPNAQFTLVMSDSSELHRTLSRSASGETCTLREGGDETRWRVVTRKNIKVTDRLAIEDATKIHSRGDVEISWAIPLDVGRQTTGRFWAFFPTKTNNGVAGILNAPWKLNTDRDGLIAGKWNEYLLKRAAVMIAEELPKLSMHDDIGKHLDAFPRQVDKDEIAAYLVEDVWKGIEAGAMIPDMQGIMKKPMELFRHPRDFADVNESWGERASDDVLQKYAHPSCLVGDRGKRLALLARRIEEALGNDSAEYLGSPNLRRKSEAEWFETVASEDLSGAVRTMKLVSKFRDKIRVEEWSSLRPMLQIIPTVSDGLKPADLVFFAPPDTRIPGKFVVSEEVANDPEAKELAMGVLGVKPLDDDGWRSVLKEALFAAKNSPGAYAGWQHPTEKQEEDRRWTHFWTTLRMSPEQIRWSFVSLVHQFIKVLNRAMEWVGGSDVLRSGCLIDSNDADNSKHVTHPVFHKDDAEILDKIGIHEIPSLKWTEANDTVLDSVVLKHLDPWVSAVHAVFIQHVTRRYRIPQKRSLILQSLSYPEGWHFITLLKGRANAALTQKLLEGILTMRFTNEVMLMHKANPGENPVRSHRHPVFWMLLEYGGITVGGKILRFAALVQHRNRSALGLIPFLDKIRPVMDMAEHCIPGVTPLATGTVAFWQAMFTVPFPRETVDNDGWSILWNEAAADEMVPDTLPIGGHGTPLSEVFVTSSRDLARHARTVERIVITLDDRALGLWKAKGAQDLSAVFKPTFDEALGPVAALVSLAPHLAKILKPASGDDESSFHGICQLVCGLRLETGDHQTPIPCLLQDGVILYDEEQMDALSFADRLQLLLAEASGAGWLRMDADAAFGELFNRGVTERRNLVAATGSLGGRLLRAVGKQTEPLRNALGGLGTKTFLDQCNDLELAELVLALLGPVTLSNAAVCAALKGEGLNPPSRWSGDEAREFVTSIGFPLEFATSPQKRREAEEWISGPLPLPDLHDYQVEVFDGVRELLAGGDGRRRAVVCLPTGGGKTRVVVQAAVELVLKPESDRRCVLWVAQTDELCEQAVQAFRQVWVNKGTPNTELRIVRLWGGHANPQASADGQPVVVVASIQTLNNRVGSDGAAWISKPGLWVVDECHHAITSSYSRVMRWLDVEVPGTARQGDREIPILGLSATPFRGSDDDESLRLARRFDQRWFPKDQEGLYERLRSDGMLSFATHDPLDSAAGLTPGEVEMLDSLSDEWGGLKFDNLMELFNQRLAKDDDRNELILNRIQTATEASILFFGNSVEHSQEIAARLHLLGIPSAVVSGDTPATARRKFLDQFQRGKIRVLCNYKVLTTGFDAPKTDMIFIARQVFSPVMYMQMVGRGLRGLENGGTKRCKVVTVMDNLGRFQDKHPYHFCKDYFEASPGRPSS